MPMVGLAMRHGARHCPRALNPPGARSPMCREAAHRGCFASAPGERCAHFGLRKAAAGAAS
jgi:hypothetical protein